MTQYVLTEHLTPLTANLCEMRTGKDLYLSGIMMQAEVFNGNKRKYQLEEINSEVLRASKMIAEGQSLCGELNHPDSLQINLANVSHLITELRMDNRNGVGRMKLLNTPSGNIARGLIEGGVRLGVSTRGAGSVDNQGIVHGFTLTTVDIVYQPSAPEAYPDVIQEAYGSKKIMTLAEAVVHDDKAQAYFKHEMEKFIASIFKR